MNKVLKISGILAGVAAFFVLSVAAISSSADVQLKNIEVKIDFSGENFFVDQDELKQAVLDLGYHQDSTYLNSINPENIELMLENIPYVSNAEAFTEIDGSLHVNVKVREPLLRVYNDLGTSVYIDRFGMIMPLSQKYAARTAIVNGSISLMLSQYIGRNILELPEITSHPDAMLLNEIFKVASHCKDDPFWQAQFSQYFVTPAGEFEIVPRVGDHHILIGDATDLEKKLTKLKHFYAEGLNKTGWNEYKKINLKYANQVVCTKS